MPPNSFGSGGATRVLVLGASGMLGSALVHELSSVSGLQVRGTVRATASLPAAFLDRYGEILVDDVDVLDDESRRGVIAEADVVVNAVGVIKQSAGLEDHVETVRLNALLPHQLAMECAELGRRLVHVSTDCVFSGTRGGYSEDDVPDPVDFYGRSKLLGEADAPALTLRTSIIGHELQRHASLLDWFLSQPESSVPGFVNAIYTGVTTHEFARLLADVVLPNPSLCGLYHLASEPISKFDLLRLIAETYGWRGDITPFDAFRCDRSMQAERLLELTGYCPPSWPEMIRGMFAARPAWAVAPRQGGEPT